MIDFSFKYLVKQIYLPAAYLSRAYVAGEPGQSWFSEWMLF